LSVDRVADDEAGGRGAASVAAVLGCGSRRRLRGPGESFSTVTPLASRLSG
jgi:hypothetical protein